MATNSEKPGKGSEIERLVAEGDYEGAAKKALTSGDPARAATLFERIWDHAAAANAAEAAGDLPRALKNAIDAGPPSLVARFLASIRDADDATRRNAADVLEHRRRFADAAELAETLGDSTRAIDLYRRGHRDLDAARLLDQAGDDREAGRLLERFIAHSEPGPQRARAELHRGLILARRMQHEHAAKALQAAAADPVTRDRARRALIVELCALGLRNAARAILADARKDDPSIPATIDEVVRLERPAARPPGNREAPLIAGRYRLGPVLGSGGAGRVHRAHDEVTGRDVAIKLLTHAPAERSAARERFVREARIAAGLSHPNLVGVLDVSIDQGFLVMELLHGGSLASRLPPALPEPACQRLALEVIAGLESAHQRGAIHRDIKPANIFFDARGVAKLGDFGIAHLTDLGVTQTGGLIGTLAYMAPEQITGADITIATDVYGLGATLFEALTGRLPFLGPDLVAQHLGDTPPAPSDINPDISGDWDPIVLRMMAKNPADRYGTTEALARDIAAIKPLSESSPRPLILPARKNFVAPPQQPASPEADSTPESPPRYQFETPIAQIEGATMVRALDSALERSVIIERWTSKLDSESETRLYALAHGGGPYLQRVLAYDRDAAVAVFEAPTGRSLADFLADGALPPRAVVRLIKRLARAVAPLHERGQAHGALSAHTVVLDDAGLPTVLASGLGPARRDARPRDDVSDILAIAGQCLDLPPSPEPLLDRVAPLLSQPERAAILALVPAESGEALYTFADALEIALLKADLRDADRPRAPE